MTGIGILMTGATGAFGSEILPLLLEEGYRVFCLVREKGGVSPQKRLDEISHSDRRAIAVHGDVCEPYCGVSETDRAALRGKISFILHGAASIAFEDEKAALATNVEGVKNTLEIAEMLEVGDFRHISTAYIAGDALKFGENDLYIEQRFPNLYAHTKFTGETMVRAWAHHRHDRRYTIFRPSILVGRENGTAAAFDTYYGYMWPYWVNAESVRRRALEKKALPNDIQVDCNGQVYLPLAVRMSKTSTLNLVTIDWCARTLVDLLTFTPADTTYHLVHPHPPRVYDVLEISLRHLNIMGPRVAETENEYLCARQEQSRPLSILQMRLDRAHRPFLPYVTAEPIFDMKFVSRELKDQFCPPPPIDAALIARLLSYAVETGWGQKPRLACA